MATYNKKLKTLEVHLMLDGSTFTIADTADDAKASMALAQFKEYNDLVWSDEQGVTTIPYHAVQYIKVTEADAEVTNVDPYGCDE